MYKRTCGETKVNVQRKRKRKDSIKMIISKRKCKYYRLGRRTLPSIIVIDKIDRYRSVKQREKTQRDDSELREHPLVV